MEGGGLLFRSPGEWEPPPPAQGPNWWAPAPCPSRLSPRLEGGGGARGRGVGATGCCSHRSPLPSLSLRAPRTAASCNLGPARPRGGGGLPLPPHLSWTPALHLVGRGLKPKKSTPLVFFFYFFFFSKRSYFLQWFYTEGKHKQKKKIIYVNLPLLFPASRNSLSALKPKRASSRSQGKGMLLRSPLSAAPLCLLRAPRDPVNMVPESRCGVFSAGL